jgi:chromosome segregation ATPase
LNAFADWDGNSADLTQWLNDGSIGDEPAKPLHRELERTMRVVEEEDYEQGFWEKRQYACRNRLMHCSILDERVCGKYEEVSKGSSPSMLQSSILKRRDGILTLEKQVLQHIQADLESLDRSLPADQLANVDKYRTMISRFRSRWFVLKSVDRRNQVTWKPNAEAKKHLEELKSPRVYDHSENDIGQLHKTISELTKELKEIKDVMKSNEKLVSSTRRIALASLEVAANAVPSLAVIDDLTL